MSPLTEPTRLTLAKGQPVPNDPNFAFNSLLLHGNGTNGSTVITDSSGSPKTVTAVGNAQISTTQSKFGGASIAFDGNGDYISIPNNNDFNLGLSSVPYTLEFWFYRNGSSDGGLFGKGGGSASWGTSSSYQYYASITFGTLYWQFNDNLDSIPVSLSVTSPAGDQWHHYAVSYDGVTTKAFINGTLFGSSTSPYASPSSTPLIRCGLSLSDDNPFNGYIDDLRITKGVARYTSNFTPPTAPFPDF